MLLDSHGRQIVRHNTIKSAAAKIEPAVTPSTVAASYLRADQVIQLLPISRRSLGNWTRTGVLPCYRIKRVLLFKRADIEAALERFRTPNRKRWAGRVTE